MKKYFSLRNISIFIFTIALFLPAWTISSKNSGGDVLYGYEVGLFGLLGIFFLYLPAYFIVPAGVLIQKITDGKDTKITLSSILLFLFWIEGFIGVKVFKWGGVTDVGDMDIISIGPSFWMWTTLVWYILLSAHCYQKFDKEKMEKYIKILSIISLTLIFIIIISFYLNL